uniref:Uncharacterized protein n=1 Tax=Arundo donax TaxID=35708 RepID=A0A0A9C4N4_ARUDO
MYNIIPVIFPAMSLPTWLPSHRHLSTIVQSSGFYISALAQVLLISF